MSSNMGRSAVAFGLGGFEPDFVSNANEHAQGFDVLCGSPEENLDVAAAEPVNSVGGVEQLHNSVHHQPLPKLKVLDLFSGLGAFSLGLERTGGFVTVAFCEIDPYCQRVLARHWPGVPCFEDITTLRGESVGTIDAICGGFPCQDLSYAGLGAGLDGARSGLWSHYARLVGELRPKLAIVENVTALLARGMGRVLGDLAALGYDAEWHSIPASAVGAPHGRDRTWIVAYPQRDEQPRQEPRLGSLGRMGRLQQSVAWDRGWEATLSALRGMDDGLARSVDRTDACRNAVVPQIPELLGNAILESMREAA